jgi:hypothetical protein
LLGEALGQFDTEGAQLERVLKVSAASDYPGIARGYLLSIAANHPEHLTRANQLLDELQRTHPRAILDIVSYGAEAIRPLQRFLAMIDAGSLPVEYLRSASSLVRQRRFTSEEWAQILNRLLDAIEAGSEEAGRVAVHLLWVDRRRGLSGSQTHQLNESVLRQLLPKLLKITLPTIGREEYAWTELLKDVAGLDPEAAIRLAVDASASVNISLGHSMQSYLTTAASNHPDLVMKYLGEGFLNPTTGWRLSTFRLSSVIAALPDGVVTPWLNDHGDAAARAIAQHLPAPHLDAGGNPVVPEVTAYVLEHFERDDVFEAFCGGLHNGQVYIGDIAAAHEREADVARRFLDHPQRRIQQWAETEIAYGSQVASWYRARDEEMTTP